MASGEFKALDAICATLLMLAVWRFSLGVCGRNTDRDVFLQTHFDLLVHGLCQQKGQP